MLNKYCFKTDESLSTSLPVQKIMSEKLEYQKVCARLSLANADSKPQTTTY